ncbi:MAG: diacylglycerol kinase family lipid kinase [SAR324 cluster bacterium]|uniref:Diacylglycerol kinase family lipid kinase n=1 Tax=SAR324 cluster bacterium TaxID=2024889 RepID=A0A432GWW9_9DELT|nr:diacylglycerol kinase family lipid kinase [SAR324 cluster bacterium]MCH2283081.1 diacylglycerol kinase family lipid kinase [SAR324 cluster bacterium]RTZ88042.1 MAG: diacylglycerol kinase family lipid kinase [SAR324 cluster bacterium]
MKTIVIVNPQAGNGRTEKIWPNIESALEKSIGSFEVLQTTCRGDATDLSRRILAVDTVRIVAVGGDGHLNEVLNGFIENDLPVNPEARLSFVMTGTGCDFQRSLGISGKWQNAAAKLKDAKVRKIDVGKVTYTAADKTQKIRYFDNIASFGLSGAVDHCLEHSRLRNYLGGSPLFLWATIKTVFTHPNQSIRFRINDGPEEEICSRLGLLANGRYFGGAMHAAPEAELDDGLLDLLMLKEISVAKFLWHLPKIYKGTHLKIPEIFFQKVRKFTAESSEQVILDIDGESPGYLAATFEVLPKILNLQI